MASGVQKVAGEKYHFFWEGEGRECPSLKYAPMLFRRRLSVLTRATVEVLHFLLQECPDAAEYQQVFISVRGEMAREFSIEKALIQDGEILPADFTLSVFNTAIAQSAILLGLKKGYCVVAVDELQKGLMLARAKCRVLQCPVIAIWGEEAVLDDYRGCKNGRAINGVEDGWTRVDCDIVVP